MLKKKVWLVGAGAMSVEYIKVLWELPCAVTVIGRGEESARRFEEITDVPVIRGGLKSFLSSCDAMPDAVIVSVGVLEMAKAVNALMDYGIKKMLIEKPGGIDLGEIRALSEKADATNCQVFIAYNRRFYSSVLAAREMIAADGGVTSFQFDFTEWISSIEKLGKPAKELNGWLLTNSGHVMDLAFFLCGEPSELISFTGGHLPWHSAGSIFTGAGVSNGNVPFSYHANWTSAGRWGVEINTAKRKLIFRPLEKLQVMEMSSVKIEFAAIDDALDMQFKPGVYLETKAYLADDTGSFMTIHQQVERMQWYYKLIQRDEAE